MANIRLDRVGAVLPRSAVRTIVALIAAAAVGCSGGGGGGGAGDPHGPCDLTGGPSTAGAGFGGLDYAVVGGLTGRGDGTTLHIAADGAFGRHTTQRGDEQGTLDPAALQDLVARARAAEFPTLCQKYAAPGAGDDLVAQVSVHFDAAMLTVHVSEFADPPDRLQALLAAVQQILDRPLH